MIKTRHRPTGTGLDSNNLNRQECKVCGAFRTAWGKRQFGRWSNGPYCPDAPFYELECPNNCRQGHMHTDGPVEPCLLHPPRVFTAEEIAIMDADLALMFGPVI